MDIDSLPNDATGDAIRRWIADGSDLTRPIVIEFFIAVPDEITGKRLAAAPYFAEFKISVEQDDPPAGWTCYLSKSMLVTYQALTAIEQALEAQAVQHDASYEGFGSYGNSV